MQFRIVRARCIDRRGGNHLLTAKVVKFVIIIVEPVVDRIALADGLLGVGRGADVGDPAGHFGVVFVTGCSVYKVRSFVAGCNEPCASLQGTLS